MIRFHPDELMEAVNSDPEFLWKAKYWASALVRLQMGDDKHDIRIVDGRIESIEAASDTNPDLRLSGSTDSWEKVLAAVPPPFYQDVLSGALAGIELEGDIVSVVGPFAPAIQRFASIMRGLNSGPVPISTAGDPWPDTDTATGRYVRIAVDGVTYRVYVEEAGTGDVPLLLQHTAGADSRQWRHVLSNPTLQSKFRMVSYDLPYHGKSVPPTDGHPWWASEYEVSKDDLMNRIVAISQAVGLDRPIFMGCSVGGHLAADLAAHHGEKFRACVSINGWYELEAFGGFTNDYFHHPHIWPEYYGALDMSATAPAPLTQEPLRRETYWIYASGGPGVYKGDNEFFMKKHDLRQDGHLIDTSVTPLWVLAGEYDPTLLFPASGAQAIADNVPGSHFRVLKGLSHFAMSDDPQGFCRQVIPILEDVVAETEKAGGKKLDVS